MMSSEAISQPVDDYAALKLRLSELCDPEIPVLTLEDLGIIRGVSRDGNDVVVTITPTYSGCPAMDAIESEVQQVLDASPLNGTVETVFDPPWTTDWLSEDGRRKLKEYGIAPPAGTTSKRALLGDYSEAVHCPRCDSTNTRVISQFGSTACKALYQCQSCLEPFDYFKCH